MKTNTFDVVVVGSGISGLTAAAAAATDRNKKVALVTTGPGSFVFGSGTMKAQGFCYESQDPAVHQAIAFFCDTARLAGCPFAGDLTSVRPLPTLLGELKGITLAPASVWGSSLNGISTAIIGVSGISSFDEHFLAERLSDNANRIGAKSTYVAKRIDLAADFGTPITLLRIAQRFDRNPEFRAQLSDALRAAANGFEHILVPGMLGLSSDYQQLRAFESTVGCGISEMATLPPSVPSLRVYHLLKAHLQTIGVEIYQGFPVSELEIKGGVCTALQIQSPARPMILHSGSIILATGQYATDLLGGASSHDEQMHPLDSSGNILAANLFVAGSLSHKGLGGDIAGIVTGYRAGMLSVTREVCFAK